MRAVLGMDRKPLAELLGISVETLKNVEYDCQTLGAAASRNMLDLVAQKKRGGHIPAPADTQGPAVREVSMDYGTPAGDHTTDGQDRFTVDRIVDLALDPESGVRAAQVAAGLGITERQALAMVVKARLKEK